MKLVFAALNKKEKLHQKADCHLLILKSQKLINFPLLSISFPKYSDGQAFYQLICIINKDLNNSISDPKGKGVGSTFRDMKLHFLCNCHCELWQVFCVRAVHFRNAYYICGGHDKKVNCCP